MNYSIQSSKDNKVHVITWDDKVFATVTGPWEVAAGIGRCRSVTKQMEQNIKNVETRLKDLQYTIDAVGKVSTNVYHALAAMETL